MTANGEHDRWALANAARRGDVERMLLGVYRDPRVPADPRLPLAVAQRYLDRHDRGDALLIGESGLAACMTEGIAVPDRPLVAVPTGRKVQLRNAPFDVMTLDWSIPRRRRHDGLWLADLGLCLALAAAQPHVSDRDLRVASYDLIQRSMVTAVSLLERWRQLGKLPGAQRLLEMAAFLEHESEGEFQFFHRVLVGRGPLPDCQVEVVRPFRVDFVYLAAALVIEYLGGVHERKLQEDVLRTFSISEAGFHVIEVTDRLTREPTRLAAYIHGLRVEREIAILMGRLAAPTLPPQRPRVAALRTLAPAGHVLLASPSGQPRTSR